MTISDATRTQRVKGWTNQKSKGESELEKANNPYDIAVAKTRIAEANSVLGRLGALEEQVRDEKGPRTSKQKGKEKDDIKTPVTTESDSGSLGI